MIQMAGKEEDMQKLYLEFQMIDQHIKQLEKQNTALNNQLMELMVKKELEAWVLSDQHL